MWKLWNLLFGWDYVQWRNTCTGGVARVQADGAGRAWHWTHRGHYAEVIRSAEQVLWLTCPPDKYLKGQVAREPET